MSIFKVFNPKEIFFKGCKMRQVIGEDNFLDPFVLMEHALGENPVFYPPHPHRGFEFVSYILNGKSLNEDCFGNKSVIEDGDLQWLTAGKGVVHKVQPMTERVEDITLWINLKSELKMCEPNLQEIKDNEMPVKNNVKILAENFVGKNSKITTKSPICYFDVFLKENQTFTYNFPAGWNILAYLLQGSLSISNNFISNFQALSIQNIQTQFTSKSLTNSRFLLIGGQPLNESPILHDNFIANSASALQQAIQDYSSYTNGFEKAKDWAPWLPIN